MKFKLAYPIKPAVITQVFGGNPQIYSTSTYGGIKGHNGIDFRASHGEPVYASHDGYASFQIDTGGGHGVVILSKDQFDDGKGEQCYYKSIYWHLCDSVKEPQYKSPFENKTGFTPVSLGDLIGYADNTGASTGDHLHLGLKPVAQGEDWGIWFNLEQNNGFNGAIDPQPFIENYYAQDIPVMKEEVGLLQKLIDLYHKLIGLKVSQARQ